MDSVQDLINVILWDRRLVLLPDGRVLVILNPTVANRNIAALEKRLVMQAALASETPTEEELIISCKESGYWTDEDDLILKEGEKHIAFLEAEKLKQKFVTKKTRIQDQIEETKHKLQSVLDKKNNIYLMTAEYMAHEAFILSLVQQTVLDRNGNPLFQRSNSISQMKESDRELLNILVKEVASEGTISNSELRKVARSMEWRMLWTLNREDIKGLFNVPVSDLSLNQRMLIYWSRVYDLAYESTEKPDEDVIQNDEKFDIWLQNRSNERNESDAAKKRGAPDHHEAGVILDGYYVDTCSCGVGVVKARGHGEKPRHASTCEYGIYKRYTKEEKNKIADEIYGRNSNKIRQIQLQEQSTVADVGYIDEKDLLNKKTRMMLGSKQEIHRINKR